MAGQYQPPGPPPHDPSLPPPPPAWQPQQGPQPWNAGSATPYGGMADPNAAPFTLTHKRPVRIMVVAIFCFIFAAFALLGVMAAAAGSAGLFMQAPKGVEERAFAFGLTLPTVIPVMLHIVYTAAGLVGGIMLLKRKEMAVWMLLAAFVTYTLDQAFSLPPTLAYTDEIMNATWKQQAENDPIFRRSAENAQGMMTSAMKIGAYATLVITAGIQITFGALMLSVRRWFRGEAVCKERVRTYDGYAGM